MNKFKLTNVVLYAKDWYKKSDNLWEDLKCMLVLDGYTPFTNNDVYQIILTSVNEFKIRPFELEILINEIHPNNCWKYRYYCKENAQWSNDLDVETLPQYKLEEAFIRYVLSCLRFIDKNKWTPTMPKATKHPRAEHISIQDLYIFFVKTKTIENEKSI